MSSSMSNNYVSSNVSIIPGEGCMYNEATTSNNNHFTKPYVNNDNTNMIVGTKIAKQKVAPKVMVKRKTAKKKNNRNKTNK